MDHCRLTVSLCPQRIDPELLLAGFLPIILFAGAFSLEFHFVRKLFWSAIILAGAPETLVSPAADVQPASNQYSVGPCQALLEWPAATRRSPWQRCWECKQPADSPEPCGGDAQA